MAHRFVVSCFTSDVGRLAHQPCCHEPSCTLLRLQPISSVFGVRVCGSPPHLLMNWAYSSNCPPKLSQGTLVRFRKIARRFFGGFHHCWKPRCRVHPFTRHVSCVLCFLGVQRFCCTHSVWLTQGKSLGGDSLPASGAALNDIP